ncbi:MAG: hypothetical protein HUU35_09460 [Armatimonadetes bacterium]|nr:hypothetical protein [Armatimonadota bacterium]
MSERVWCVPAELATRFGLGFRRLPAREAEALLAEWEDAGRFYPRAEVETDESLRQVIPYVLLRDPDGGYFTYRRLPAGGEARLVDLHSLGVGGHINDDGHVAGLRVADRALRGSLLAAALQRELCEELVLPETAAAGLGELSLHGFLALSQTPVDRVHVGVVAIAAIHGEHVAQCDVRETDKLVCAGWFRPTRLREMLGELPFEGWSRTLIEAGLP